MPIIDYSSATMEPVGRQQCMLQRAFQTAFQMDSNTLLAGGTPWELQDGMVDSHQSASANNAVPTIVPHVHDLWYTPRMLLLYPHSAQALILFLVLSAAAIYLYMVVRAHILGQSQEHQLSTRSKTVGLAFHIFVACISAFLRGYSLYLIGPFLTPIQRSLKLCYPCADGESDFALAACSCPMKEFAVSCVTLGAIFGGLAGGFMADRLGRRATLMSTDILFIVSSLVTTLSAPGSWTMLFFIGRVLLGVAVGASGPASHVFISELAPPNYRGQVLALSELVLCVGCFVVFGFSGFLGDSQWRIAVQFPILPALLQFFFCAFFLHESPRWLAACGNSDKARLVGEILGMESLTFESGASSTLRDPEYVKRCCDTLGLEPKKLSLGNAAPPIVRKQRSWFAALVHHRHRVCLALGCALAHNALGANVVMYYSRDVLQLAGMGNTVASQVSLGLAKVLGTCMALALVDRVGRRFLLVVGVAGALAGHFGLAAAFLLGTPQPIAMLAWVSLLLFMAAWDMSWASLMSVVVSEVLPDDVRGLGLGASCTLYWFVSFLQAQTLESLFKEITIGGTFAIYFVGSALSLIFVFIYVPETCG
eukprot:CAMPEP_0169127826 /NCGR_PEP_ID=MMETSP1015-20121227/36226_1 /TAXON_ID=342587 /ORGANISM="Karlodinium micrum, Strain CCMP2283" /LENGTH=593 /DNA_ID=CAMNT_0009191657 /DNA_START=38 /DNA_END=1816 /DNA_ORIENTATION=-